MGDNRRPQAKKSSVAKRMKQQEDSYMQSSHTVGEIDHSSRRCEERMKDHEWEGKVDWRNSSNSW